MVGKCMYRSNDTAMCTFMVDFIKKLKTGMYMREMMNVVLEHLGVLQVRARERVVSACDDIAGFVLLDSRLERHGRIAALRCIYFRNQRIIVVGRNAIGCLSSLRLELFTLSEPPVCLFVLLSKSMPFRLCRYTDHSLFSIVMFCFSCSSLLLLLFLNM